MVLERPRGAEDGEEEDDDEPYFSLVTGTFRQRRGGARGEKASEGGGGGVLIAYESPAGDFLQSRSYTGLGCDVEEQGQEGKPTEIREGARGIASSYGGV